MSPIKIRQTHNFNLYSLLWIFAFAIFIYLVRDWYYTKKFIGVVESKSHLLSAGESGRLQNVLINIGNEVKKDQVLALLDISDLKSNLNQLQNELAGIQKLEGAHRDRYSIEIRRMALQLENEADDLVERLSMIESQTTELAALNAEIERLKSAESAGLGRSRDLSDLIVQRDALTTYLKEQSKDIEFQKRNLEKARQSRTIFEQADIDGMTKSLLTEQMQYAEELQRLVAETKYRISLRTIIAPCDGYVTEILARQGDMVDAFIPIFTVEETKPAFLEVYISDKSDIVPRVGMKAEVYSSRRKEFNTTGTIAFVHPGFSMLSERFSYSGQFIWARKVQVELPKEHQLIPGEVVKVRFRNRAENNDSFALTAAAAESSLAEPQNHSAKHPELMKLELEGAFSQFEPSGITWLPDVGMYLIAGDDVSTEDAQTVFFFMNEWGKVASAPVSIVGIDAIHNVKTIASAGDETLYLVSSQNSYKESECSDRGDVITRVKRYGERFVAEGKVQLIPLLLHSYAPQELRALGFEKSGMYEQTVIDIAGAAFHDNALFLSIKKPGPKGDMIWKVNDIDDVFASHRVATNQVSLFGYVRLAQPENQTTGILDMTFDQKGTLWALSAATDVDQENPVSTLHRVNRFTDGHMEATQIFDFPGVKPEGICLQNDESFMIIFHQDSQPPLFCSINAEGL